MTQAHSDRAHATLAPSAAHRWIECPGSIRESRGIEETSSTFANEGTAAHELAGICLSMGYDADRFADYVIDIKATTPGTMFVDSNLDVDGITRFRADEEMVEAVQEFIDKVREVVRGAKGKVEMDTEQRLDMSHIHPDIWGTGDVVLYDVEAGHLHVFDLKYGKGVVVEVMDNPQLLTYGTGAARKHHNRPLNMVTLWIVQPRAFHKDGPVRKHDIHPMELFEFEADLAIWAKATEDPDAPLKAGDWCRFCPAAPTCSEHRNAAKLAAMIEFDDQGPALPAPEKMSPGELADVLAEADFIGNWVKSVQAFAHAQAMAGSCPPGWKLVPKRAIRRWRDDEEAREKLILEHEYGNEDIFAEPKFKSPAQIEKLMGKKLFEAAMGDHVVKKSSGTNLAPESDSRPAVKAEGLSEFS